MMRDKRNQGLEVKEKGFKESFRIPHTEYLFVLLRKKKVRTS